MTGVTNSVSNDRPTVESNVRQVVLGYLGHDKNGAAPVLNVQNSSRSAHVCREDTDILFGPGSEAFISDLKSGMLNEGKCIDISSCKVAASRDAREAVAAGTTRTLFAENCIATPSNRDLLQKRTMGQEICAVGRTLWSWQLIDGSGGNNSWYRNGPNEGVCTPTLVSVYDLTPEGLCLVDPTPCDGNNGRSSDTDIESLARSVTDAVLEVIGVGQSTLIQQPIRTLFGEISPNGPSAAQGNHENCGLCGTMNCLKELILNEY